MCRAASQTSILTLEAHLFGTTSCEVKRSVLIPMFCGDKLEMLLLLLAIGLVLGIEQTDFIKGPMAWKSHFMRFSKYEFP